jgi:hypothetical protein
VGVPAQLLQRLRRDARGPQARNGGVLSQGNEGGLPAAAGDKDDIRELVAKGPNGSAPVGGAPEGALLEVSHEGRVKGLVAGNGVGDLAREQRVGALVFKHAGQEVALAKVHVLRSHKAQKEASH